MLSDGLLPLKDATKEFPERNGKRPHLHTLRRWIAVGVQGKRLKAKRVGGVWYTSREWIEEFLAADSSASDVPEFVDERRAAEAALKRMFEKRGINVRPREVSRARM